MTVRQADPYGKGSYCIVVALHGMDSVEAERLRRFRDTYLYRLPGGRAAMNRYYRLSPRITHHLSHRPRLSEVAAFGVTVAARAAALLPRI